MVLLRVIKVRIDNFIKRRRRRRSRISGRTAATTLAAALVESRFHPKRVSSLENRATIETNCVWCTSESRCCRRCQRNNNVVRRWSGVGRTDVTSPFSFRGKLRDDGGASDVRLDDFQNRKARHFENRFRNIRGQTLDPFRMCVRPLK